MEGLIDVEHSLHGVGAGGHVLEAGARVALRAVIDEEWLARLPAIDGDAEDHLRLRGVVDLHARLDSPVRAGACVIGEQEQQAPIQRLRRARGGEADSDGLRKRGDGEQQGRGGECEGAGAAGHAGV